MSWLVFGFSICYLDKFGLEFEVLLIGQWSILFSHITSSVLSALKSIYVFQLIEGYPLEILAKYGLKVLYFHHIISNLICYFSQFLDPEIPLFGDAYTEFHFE